MTLGKKVRFGLVGTGAMAADTGKILTHYSGSVVAAITGRTFAHVDSLAKELESIGGESIARFDNVEGMVASGLCDAVAVMTPDDMHADATVTAAEAGLHVLIEKPLAVSVQSADRMVAAVRKAGVKSMCLYTHRWITSVAEAKRSVDQMGAPICAYTRKHDTIDVPTTMLRWASRTTCGWFLSGHDIDLVTWLFDSRIVSVSASARRGLLTGMGIDTPDAMVIHATFENGAFATFESAWVNSTAFPTQVDSYLSVVAENGTLHLDRQKEGLLVATRDTTTYPGVGINNWVHGAPRGSYPSAIEHFVDCIISDRQPLATIESARDVTSVLDAAHRAEQSGGVVLVDY